MELYAKTVALSHYELDWCTYLIRVHLPERWSSKPQCVAGTTRCNPPPFTSGPSSHCFHGDSHNWSLKIAHKSPQLIQNISFLSIYHPSLCSLSFSLFMCLVLLCRCCFLLANTVGPTSARASVFSRKVIVNTGGWNGGRKLKRWCCTTGKH